LQLGRRWPDLCFVQAGRQQHLKGQVVHAIFGFFTVSSVGIGTLLLALTMVWNGLEGI
jgi:hypothetical protein